MTPVPTPRLAWVMAAGAVVVALTPDAGAAVAPVAVVVLLIGLVDWALAPSADRITVGRNAPRIVSLGATEAIEWRVGNPTGRARAVSVADELAPSLRSEVRRFHVTVPAGGSVTARTSFTPSRRGLFAPAEVTVRVRGPLGLAARQGKRSMPAEVRVYPRFRSRDDVELRINRARILEVGLRSAQGRGGGTEFDSLREFTPDDESRRIDWSATARAGKTIVRTYRAERNQQVIVLLDNGRVMAGRVDDVPRVELAMDAVLAVTTAATRLGDRAGLVAFDREVRAVIPPAARKDQLGRVSEALYRLEPELAESDYRGAFTTTLARFRRRALLVVLTELEEQAAAETLIPAIPLIARTHLVIVGAVSDPEVARWAAEVPIDAEGVFRQAAAAARIEQRRALAARLRGLGITVVDEPPGRLAPALADAYLRVKATGRL